MYLRTKELGCLQEFAETANDMYFIVDGSVEELSERSKVICAITKLLEQLVVKVVCSGWYRKG